MPLPRFTLRTPEDEHDQKLLSDIQKFGWHVVNVNEDTQGPGFSFSFGFYYNFQQPEILVMGLRQEVAHEFLKIAYVRAAAGLPFEPYQRNSSFAQGYDCAFVPIEIEHYRDFLGYAVWFYRSLPKPFPAMQLVWPDKQGHFSWEADCDMRFMKL